MLPHGNVFTNAVKQICSDQKDQFNAGDGCTPSHEGALVYLHVDEIDPTLEAINSNGGKTLMARIGIGIHGFIAHFEDTEGNRVALHESPSGVPGESC